MLRRKISWAVIIALAIFSGISLAAVRYKSINFRDSQIDEILFYFNNGLAGGKSDNLWQATLMNLPLALLIAAMLLLPVSNKFINRLFHIVNPLIKKFKSSWQLKPVKPRLRTKLIYISAVFITTIYLLMQSFNIPSYVYALTQTSTLYEENYVDPKLAKLTFPQKKRNLIFIYLESMENTIASKANGGQAEESIIPELENLALNHTSFSHNNSGLGGALPATGTTWTVGGMAAQSAGVPLKETIFGQDHNSMGQLNKFLPGAYSLGDVLQKNGYNQVFIMGSEASFGGRDKFLSQHGNFQIQDYNYAKNHGLIAKDYQVWWGFEDKKLFEFAKNEAKRLAKSDQPFNLQLLTVDTHFTDGYLDEICTVKSANQYDNVHACSSKQVANFVAWVQEQDFAKDTTIILSGDHLGMQTSYYDEKITTPNYQRTTYNAFINPAVAADKTHGRMFSSFDIYPSTLAAMGVKIDGERLGLGTNLFSDRQTLVEQLGGIDQLNSELAKRSAYYEKKIFSTK